ncbi:hypothetical protein H0H81_002913 [Sphagnurus paluster]|uniref:BAG domain-containing protein n=1 Tax=Sphagnurus paluster TaxID=117069 RepID=A0A9P7GHX3_9AGAR|nr:hypothetical protein H0H81_002913 [Sphagnurus paluster]
MFASPYLHSSYYDPSDYYGRPSPAQLRALAQQRAIEQQQQQQQQRRAMQQRVNPRLRSQYLPHEEEDDNSDDGGAYYDTYNPRDRLYLEGLARREAMERRRREQEALNQQRAEAARQEQLWREQEELRREKLRQAHRQFQQAQAQKRPAPSPAPVRPSPSQRVPIPTPPASPPPIAKHTPPTPPRPISPATAERREEAAIAIQKAYRIHSALRNLKELERQFDALKGAHTLPTTFDFQTPEGIVSVPVSPSLPAVDSSSTPDTPRLAYNSTNYNHHSYVESLNRLLIKLDGVQSWGDATVRQTRRRVVARVEDEASRMDSCWRQVWAAHVAGQGSKPSEIESADMEGVEVKEDADVKDVGAVDSDMPDVDVHEPTAIVEDSEMSDADVKLSDEKDKELLPDQPMNDVHDHSSPQPQSIQEAVQEQNIL